MPTPMSAVDAVAEVLTDTGFSGSERTEYFYLNTLEAYPYDLKEDVCDFLVSCTDVPDAEALASLKAHVTNRLARTP